MQSLLLAHSLEFGKYLQDTPSCISSNKIACHTYVFWLSVVQKYMISTAHVGNSQEQLTQG